MESDGGPEEKAREFEEVKYCKIRLKKLNINAEQLGKTEIMRRTAWR